jgi:plasmid replication initiation protein
MRLGEHSMLMVMLGHEKDEVACGLTEFAHYQLHNISTLFSKYYYYYYYRISHFSALAGKYSPILGLSNQQNLARWSYL